MVICQRSKFAMIQIRSHECVRTTCLCKLIYVYLSLASSGSLCSKGWLPRGAEEMNFRRSPKERYSNDSIKLLSSKENGQEKKLLEII